MHRTSMSAVLSCVVLSGSLQAQRPDTNDRAFIEAAVAVIGFDLFAGRCTQQSAFTVSELATVAAWQRENDVELVRARIANLEQDGSTRQKFAQTRAAFEQRFAGVKDRMACQAAVELATQPDAQIAQRSPALVRTLREQRDGAVPGVRNTPRLAPAATPNSISQAPAPSSVVIPAQTSTIGAVARSIDAFGFNTRSEMGAGGFIGLAVYPVVLFHDGSALTDVEGLGAPGGLAAHRVSAPAKWTRWRREGEEIQLLTGGAWKKLAFRRTYSTLPRDFSLAGRFRRVGGTGSVALGGSAAVTVVSEYLFSADGRVVRDGAVASTAETGDASVVTSRIKPNLRGRYSIDGITLRIRYDDGSEETSVLVTDPADPKSAIWLDGRSFVRR